MCPCCRVPKPPSSPPFEPPPLPPIPKPPSKPLSRSLVPKNQIRGRFDQFVRGEWIGLLNTWLLRLLPRSRRRRTVLVASGEISAGRAALEGAPVALGSQATLYALTDKTRQTRTLCEPLPEELSNFQPETAFCLDRDRFLRNLRGARRGAAAGPTEHLRPLLDSTRDSDLLWELGCSFGQGRVPADAVGQSHCFAETIWWDPRYRGRGRFQASGCAHNGATIERSRRTGDIPVPACTHHSCWSGMCRSCRAKSHRFGSWCFSVVCGRRRSFRFDSERVLQGLARCGRRRGSPPVCVSVPQFVFHLHLGGRCRHHPQHCPRRRG